MQNDFNLEEYLSNGIENIIKGALRASFNNTKESVFITKYALSSKKFHKIRKKYELNGEHIPPFLIASITNNCNLNCKGCYARANNSCNDVESSELLTRNDWNKIFTEAASLGIGIIMLAGGEPFIRYEIIETAASHPSILFPIFTNGTMIKGNHLELLNKHRNLVPVLSIEGDKSYTDERRGVGVYDQLCNTMDVLKSTGILFGASITVTNANIKQVTEEDYLDTLYNRGCKVIFYVEYVPVSHDTNNLAPSDDEREYLTYKLLSLRKCYKDMIFISFPGDEKASGGCLAAGRGFFHISPSGAAQPCPFSPYSDTNIKEISLKEALNSPLFKKLQQEDVLLNEHIGGCVLYEQKELVQKLCEGGAL